MKKIAICQPRIIKGGRLSVILDIIKSLNDINITPDILSEYILFSKEDAITLYKKDCSFNVIPLRKTLLPYMHEDLHILLFNKLLKTRASKYDILINTSNSIINLPKDKTTISYVFFPRKYRLTDKAHSIHEPDRKPNWSVQFAQRKLLSKFYNYKHAKDISTKHKIIPMTEFTRMALNTSYPKIKTTPLLYPAVNIDDYTCNTAFSSRDNIVVSFGRFGEDKRQFQQIKIAAMLPEMTFHICGFVNSNSDYFNKCQNYITTNKISNVVLNTNCTQDEKFSLLQKSKFFLHTLINEPFGLTTVEAIAAGCIPLVHQSGGQQETVTENHLQYKSLAQIPSIIQQLTQMRTEDINALRSRLTDHIQIFSLDCFKSNFLQTIREAL